MATRRRRLGLLALIAVVVPSAFIIVAFYTRAPSAIRVVASTGFVRVDMGDPNADVRVSWPFASAQICGAGDELQFDPETADEDGCPDGKHVSGTLWFEPGAAVSVVMRSRSHVEVEITGGSEGAGGAVAVLRTLKGDAIALMAPARIRVAPPSGGTSSSLVLPVVGREVQVGEETRWQALAPPALLQDGQVALVRSSVFGDILFSSEEFPLVLGDRLRVEAQGRDYIQGVLQVSDGPFFDVSFTAGRADAWLYRLARDPRRLDTPLAAQLIRDPTLIITWGVLALLVGGMLRLTEVIIASRQERS